MELKKHLRLRNVLIGLYAVAFVVYLVVGLQPAEAAKSYEIAAELDIPSIGLVTGVTELGLDGGKLDTPDTVVGSYTRAENKTLLIGHSSTVFGNLKDVKIGNAITYNGVHYSVVKERLAAKEVIDMDEILASEEKDTIVIMTCDGKMLDGGDATHRFIVTAVAE